MSLRGFSFVAKSPKRWVLPFHRKGIKLPKYMVFVIKATVQNAGNQSSLADPNDSMPFGLFLGLISIPRAPIKPGVPKLLALPLNGLVVPLVVRQICFKTLSRAPKWLKMIDIDSANQTREFDSFLDCSPTLQDSLEPPEWPKSLNSLFWDALYSCFYKTDSIKRLFPCNL